MVSSLGRSSSQRLFLFTPLPAIFGTVVVLFVLITQLSPGRTEWNDATAKSALQQQLGRFVAESKHWGYARVPTFQQTKHSRISSKNPIPNCTMADPVALQEELDQSIWRDVDFGGDRNGSEASSSSIAGGTCGQAKCFFPSRSSQSVGYLVGWASLYPQMSAASLLVRDWEPALGTILEFPGQIPQLVKISSDLACRLVRNSRQPHRSATRQAPVFALSTKQVVVHRVRKLTQPCIILGISQGKRRYFFEHWPSFIKDNRGNALAAFMNFQRQVKQIEQAMAVHPQLVNDFQGLVDIEGNFFHMDMDRLFEPNITQDDLEFWRDMFNQHMPRLSKRMMLSYSN